MFDDSKDEFKGMYFGAITRKVMDTSATQIVMLANMKGADIPMAKFVSTKDMYMKDLEKKHKALVDMHAISHSLSTLLDSLVTSNKMRENTYRTAMEAYSPFLETYLDYATFLSKVQTVTSDEGWV